MELRYDRRALTYERCWAPVLRAPALSLLDLVATEAARPGASILDVGTGAGTLAIGAVERFPRTLVTALDVSSGMLERARAAVALAPGDAVARITFVHASIDGAVGGPIAEAAFDAAVSSFVLQLVPDRAAALAAIRRALRPGGRLAFVVWADNAKPDGVAAAWSEAFDGVLAETGLPAPNVPNPVSSGPIPDPAAAAAELAAGRVHRCRRRPNRRWSTTSAATGRAP